MPTLVHLVIAGSTRCEKLKRILSREPEFGVVSSDPNIAKDSSPVDLYIVDLAHPYASLPVFWMGAHAISPGARFVALLDLPIVHTTFETALHGGAYYAALWDDPDKTILSVIHAARAGCAYIPSQPIFEAMSHIFQSLDWDSRDVYTSVLCVDLTQQRVALGAQPICLPPREFQVLSYLALNAGRTISHMELLHRIWEQDAPTRRMRKRVGVVISRLRSNIEPNPKRPQFIKSNRGCGYLIPTGRVHLQDSVWPAQIRTAIAMMPSSAD